MRAAQVVAYHQPVKLVDVPEPKIVDPYDVIVRIAGAGVCRTDIHIMQGGLEAASTPSCRTPSATRTLAGSRKWAGPYPI